MRATAAKYYLSVNICISCKKTLIFSFCTSKSHTLEQANLFAFYSSNDNRSVHNHLLYAPLALRKARGRTSVPLVSQCGRRSEQRVPQKHKKKFKKYDTPVCASVNLSKSISRFYWVWQLCSLCGVQWVVNRFVAQKASFIKCQWIYYVRRKRIACAPFIRAFR